MGAEGAGPVRCEDASRHLTKVVDGVDLLPSEVTEHVQRCLRCQVEAIRYRRVGRTMRQLATQVASPGPGLAVDILSLIEAAEASAGDRPSRYRRAAYVAAAATATAAGAAGALAIARSRRGRLDLAG